VSDRPPPSSQLAKSSRRYSGVHLGTLPPEDSKRVLEVTDINVSFGKRRVLEDVTFFVPVGEFLCLCGPNGAGKSTLLKIILGLVEPDSGSVLIEGQPAAKARRLVGYVPQRKGFDRDFPATPLDLVVANLRGTWPVAISKSEREQAMEALKRTGAAKLAGAQMKDLSGGETQRVYLARALVTKPNLIILDEPTAGVDVGGRAAIIDLMAEISASETLAAVLVTHNLQAIARCAERVIYLDKKIRAWGLWKELAPERELAAIQGGDHPDRNTMDGD
jgi:ABC-type Mn2+/Zn2+ transport system ATPase subunit